MKEKEIAMSKIRNEKQKSENKSTFFQSSNFKTLNHYRKCMNMKRNHLKKFLEELYWQKKGSG